MPSPTADTAAPPPGVRRRGVILLDEQELAYALRLPDEWRLIGFEPKPIRLSIAVHVEGDGLPECPLGAEAPFVAGGPVYPLNVTGRPPGEQHAEVLAALDGFRLEHAAVTEGRRRILVRHAPDVDGPVAGCSHCCEYIGGFTGVDPVKWPCPDYADAAADLVVGLGVAAGQRA